MKKVIGFCLCLLILGTSALFADEYDLPDVDEKYIGTYIPCDYDESLRTTFDYNASLKLGYPNHHDVLFLGKNICYSDAHFADGYAIKAEDFEKYVFSIEDSTGDIFITDDKGYKYRRITDYLDSNGYGYNDFLKYTIDVIFRNVKGRKNIVIEENSIRINGKLYNLELCTGWNDNTNVLFWLGKFPVVRNGLNAEIRNSKYAHHTYSASDEVIDVIPLFFLDEENYADVVMEGLPKNQLRLLRNYVFARHGYKFKSEDLQNTFANFEWYKTNPKFSEKSFSEEENAFIKKIQALEK